MGAEEEEVRSPATVATFFVDVVFLANALSTTLSATLLVVEMVLMVEVAVVVILVLAGNFTTSGGTSGFLPSVGTSAVLGGGGCLVGLLFPSPDFDKSLTAANALRICSSSVVKATAMEDELFVDSDFLVREATKEVFDDGVAVLVA